MSGFDTNALLQGLMTAGGTVGGSFVGQPQLGAMAGGMAGQALFADDQKHGMAVPAGGPGGGNQGAGAALSILQALQQQMHSQEQQRQQAIMTLLTQYSSPPGAVQMESRS